MRILHDHAAEGVFCRRVCDGVEERDSANEGWRSAGLQEVGVDMAPSSSRMGVGVFFLGREDWLR